MTESALLSLTANTTNEPRTAVLQGVEYMVLPMVMLTEGVHTGSTGALLYAAEHMRDSVSLWNAKPVVVRHPENGVSACSEEVLNNVGVGLILNVRYNEATEDRVGRLVGEAWLVKNRLPVVNADLAVALVGGQKVEISTGLWTARSGGAGVWNNQLYEAQAIDFRPDHLALLPDQIGACSMSKGCGCGTGISLNTETTNPAIAATAKAVMGDLAAKAVAMVGNSGMSYGDISAALYLWVQSRYPEARIEMGNKVIYAYAYIEEVFADFFIFEVRRPDGTTAYYKQTYTVTAAGAVEVPETPPVEVREVVEYLPVEVAVQNTLSQETAMSTAAPAPAAEAPAPAAPIVQNNTPTLLHSIQEVMAAVDPALAVVLNQAFTALQDAKEASIATITANASNPFPREDLAKMDMGVLKGMAKLSATPAPVAAPVVTANAAAPQTPAPVAQPVSPPNFEGAAGGLATHNTASAMLTLPGWGDK